jgi:DNA-directed RNA polymerase subunit RPC12/RpoP
MDKSHRTRLKNKNIVDNWTLRENKRMTVCIKCKRYNSIINASDVYINCMYCGNPNFINK